MHICSLHYCCNMMTSTHFLANKSYDKCDSINRCKHHIILATKYSFPIQTCTWYIQLYSSVQRWNLIMWNLRKDGFCNNVYMYSVWKFETSIYNNTKGYHSVCIELYIDITTSVGHNMAHWNCKNEFPTLENGKWHITV